MRQQVLLLAGVLLAAGSSLAAPDRNALDGDPRLEQQVRLHAPVTTLRQACGDLKQQTGVDISADEAVRGFTVCVEAEGTPIRQVMQCLGEYAGYNWIRSGQQPDFHYRLTQDLKGRNEEERLRLEHLHKALEPADRYIELMSEFAKKFERMEPKDVAAEVERLRGQMESLPVSKERFAAEQQFFAASHASQPEELALLRAYQALPSEAVPRLVRGERVLMASTGLAGAVPMPEAVRSALARARATSSSKALGMPPPVDPNGGEAVEFRTQRRDVDAGIIIQAKSPRYGMQSRAPRWTAPAIALTPSRAENAEPGFQVTGKVLADRPADLQRPLVLHYTLPKRSTETTATLFGSLTLAQIMWSVEHADTSLHIIGDSPLVALGSRVGVRNENPRAAFYAAAGSPKFTLGALCDEIAARMPMNVHVRRDGWVILSSAVPYDRRDTSIDPEWLKARFQPVLEASKLTPQAAGAAAVELTRGQARALGDLRLQFLPDLIAPGELDRNYPFWRLVGALKQDRQDALLGGQPLRFGSLASEERRAAQEFLSELSGDPDGAPYDLELSPDNLRALEVALGDSRPLPPEAVAAQAANRGEPRLMELRLSRPPMVLQRKFVSCRWN